MLLKIKLHVLVVYAFCKSNFNERIMEHIKVNKVHTFLPSVLNGGRQLHAEAPLIHGERLVLDRNLLVRGGQKQNRCRLVYILSSNPEKVFHK
jgi:hypothetical protein